MTGGGVQADGACRGAGGSRRRGMGHRSLRRGLSENARVDNAGRTNCSAPLSKSPCMNGKRASHTPQHSPRNGPKLPHKAPRTRAQPHLHATAMVLKLVFTLLHACLLNSRSDGCPASLLLLLPHLHATAMMALLSSSSENSSLVPPSELSPGATPPGPSSGRRGSSCSDTSAACSPATRARDWREGREGMGGGYAMSEQWGR